MRSLVKRYKQDTSLIDGKMRDQLIMDYAHLIRYIAQRIIARLPGSIELDDLISAGVIGLMDAIDKYDPSRDNKFKTYAEYRIRGAILDEIRSQDWIPRSVRDKVKYLEKTYTSLEQKYGRTVEDKELSDALGLTLDEYYEMLSKIKSTSLMSIDDMGGSHNKEKKNILEFLENVSTKNPFMHLQDESIRVFLKKYIESLPDKLKLVLSLYYYEDLSLREISRIMNITESRVSQLHTTALMILKEKLTNIVVE